MSCALLQRGLAAAGKAYSQLIAALVLSLLVVQLSRADDWPQWLGPQRDAIWRETGIIDKFPAGGPPIRWRVPIGGGYTGPAVAEGRVYVMDRQVAAKKEGATKPAAGAKG